MCIHMYICMYLCVCMCVCIYVYLCALKLPSFNHFLNFSCCKVLCSRTLQANDDVCVWD